MATWIVGLAPTDLKKRGRQVEFRCAGPYSQLTSRSSGFGRAGSSAGRATRTADGTDGTDVGSLLALASVTMCTGDQLTTS